MSTENGPHITINSDKSTDLSKKLAWLQKFQSLSTFDLPADFEIQVSDIVAIFQCTGFQTEHAGDLDLLPSKETNSSTQKRIDVDIKYGDKFFQLTKLCEQDNSDVITEEQKERDVTIPENMMQVVSKLIGYICYILQDKKLLELSSNLNTSLSEKPQSNAQKICSEASPETSPPKDSSSPMEINTSTSKSFVKSTGKADIFDTIHKLVDMAKNSAYCTGDMTFTKPVISNRRLSDIPMCSTAEKSPFLGDFIDVELKSQLPTKSRLPTSSSRYSLDPAQIKRTPKSDRFVKPSPKATPLERRKMSGSEKKTPVSQKLPVFTRKDTPRPVNAIKTRSDGLLSTAREQSTFRKNLNSPKNPTGIVRNLKTPLKKELAVNKK